MAKKYVKFDNLLDKRIESVFRENCSNIQINIMDMTKIFEEGRRAIKESRDLKQSIIDFVETIRKN